MLTALTEVQAQVMRFVQTYQAENQCSPTRAEIAANFGWSSANAAQDVLSALERKGRIRLIGGRSRGIFVLNALEA